MGLGILPSSPFRTSWMLVDAAFGSAQLARAGARGLGVGGVVFV